jgi:hypothetical protein
MRCITASAQNEAPNQGAFENRSPTGQLDGLDNLSAMVTVRRAIPAVGTGSPGVNMRFLATFLCVLILGCSSIPNEEIAKSAFLQPCVDELMTHTPPADLDRIRTMAESELWLFHHGYGTGIRNKWLWGNRNPELVRFFQDNGIAHPDDMSMVLIEALWHALNSNLSPEERASIEAKRTVVARKRLAYERLESQCEVHLLLARAEFERCYARHGLPSRNPSGRKPFFKLVVEMTGSVREIVFYEGASSDLKACLEEIIQRFRFDAFTDDETVTLHILDFPRCRVLERDRLHED